MNCLPCVTEKLVSKVKYEKPRVGYPTEPNAVPYAVKRIKSIVSRHFGLPFDILANKTRKREVVYARQISMHLIAMNTQLSLKSIGSHFGGRDHTTVIHARDTLKDLMESDPSVRMEIESLQEKV